MRLDVYVPSVQVMDWGMDLAVGSRIGIDLIGHPGSTSGSGFSALDAYIADTGATALRRIGLAEYAFSGQIRKIQSIEDYAGKGYVYREVLVDCGVPLIYVTLGFPGFSPLDLDELSNHELSVGRYLSGLAMLEGLNSVRDPQLIDEGVSGWIRSIGVVEVAPTTARFGESREVQTIDTRNHRFPLVLGLEL